MAGGLLGVPSGQVEESLKSFRELIESESTAPAGWRGRIESTEPQKTSVNNEMTPVLATTSAGGVPVSSETETDRQTVAATETQSGEHQAGIIARPNDIDQALQNLQPALRETECPLVNADPTGTTRPLQTVPLTDLEAGEHEAGMVARASDQEKTPKAEPKDLATTYSSRRTRKSPSEPTILISLAGKRTDTNWMTGERTKRQLVEARSSESD